MNSDLDRKIQGRLAKIYENSLESKKKILIEELIDDVLYIIETNQSKKYDYQSSGTINVDIYPDDVLEETIKKLSQHSIKVNLEYNHENIKVFKIDFNISPPRSNDNEMTMR